MFVLLLLLAGSSSASAVKCQEIRNISLLDCSRRQLSSLPCTDRSIMWVRSLDLKWNNFVNVNFSCVLANFPNILLIDLRHNPFNCVYTDLVRVLDDCNHTSPIIVKPATSVVYDSTSVVSTIVSPRFSTYCTPTKTRPTVTPSSVNISYSSISEKVLLMIILLPAGILALGFLIYCVFVRKCRRRRNREILTGGELYAMVTMSSRPPSFSTNSSSDSEVTLFCKESTL